MRMARSNQINLELMGNTDTLITLKLSPCPRSCYYNFQIYIYIYIVYAINFCHCFTPPLGTVNVFLE